MTLALSFDLLGETVQGILTAKMNSVVKSTYAGWFSEAHSVYFTITHVNERFDINNIEWDIFANSSEYWLAFKKDEKMKSQIMSEMFELEPNLNLKVTKFLEAIYQDFIESNLQAIFSLADTTCFLNRDISNLSLNQGSGAVIGKIGNNFIELPIAISGGLIKLICHEANKEMLRPAPTSNLYNREVSLDKYKSKVEVMAGKISVSLQEFTKIEVGDVVLLNSKIGDSFPVSLSDRVLAHAQLGKIANKKAIQLIE